MLFKLRHSKLSCALRPSDIMKGRTHMRPERMVPKRLVKFFCNDVVYLPVDTDSEQLRAREPKVMCRSPAQTQSSARRLVA
jgi:hypothetical protein